MYWKLCVCACLHIVMSETLLDVGGGGGEANASYMQIGVCLNGIFNFEHKNGPKDLILLI